MKRIFIRFKKAFAHTMETEHINLRGPERITTATFRITKGSVLEVWQDKDGDVWIDPPGCHNRAVEDRIDVQKEYYEILN